MFCNTGGNYHGSELSIVTEGLRWIPPSIQGWDPFDGCVPARDAAGRPRARDARNPHLLERNASRSPTQGSGDPSGMTHFELVPHQARIGFPSTSLMALQQPLLAGPGGGDVEDGSLQPLQPKSEPDSHRHGEVMVCLPHLFVVHWLEMRELPGAWRVSTRRGAGSVTRLLGYGCNGAASTPGPALHHALRCLPSPAAYTTIIPAPGSWHPTPSL